MAAYIKANDADGKKLKLARKEIAHKKRADEAKALIKAEDDFIKFASNRLTAPSKKDFTKAAAFLRGKLQPQIVAISKLGPDQSAEKWKLCQNLTFALPQNMRELCEFKVTKRDDQIVCRLDIMRSHNGVEHSFPVFVLGECDNTHKKKPETIMID